MHLLAALCAHTVICFYYFLCGLMSVALLKTASQTVDKMCVCVRVCLHNVSVLVCDSGALLIQ